MANGLKARALRYFACVLVSMLNISRRKQLNWIKFAQTVRTVVFDLASLRQAWKRCNLICLCLCLSTISSSVVLRLTQYQSISSRLMWLHGDVKRGSKQIHFSTLTRKTVGVPWLLWTLCLIPSATRSGVQFSLNCLSHICGVICGEQFFILNCWEMSVQFQSWYIYLRVGSISGQCLWTMLLPMLTQLFL